MTVDWSKPLIFDVYPVDVLNMPIYKYPLEGLDYDINEGFASAALVKDPINVAHARISDEL